MMPLFLIPILVGLITQGIKPLFNRQWYAQLDEMGGRKIPRYGGMPSAHTSFAFSLATVVAMTEGFFSATFAIAAVMVVIIMDDSLRMRIFLGRYGAALRKLIQKLPEEERRHFPYLEERLGHRPREVIAGAIVGVVLTSLIMAVLTTFPFNL